MKIKIRCDGCARQIAVDEAFIGGVCRCPFCKALVAIDGGVLGGREGSRPEAPGLETQRPQSPALQTHRARGTPAVGAPRRPVFAEDLAARAARQKSVPTASPVKVVNIVAILMALALAAMIAVGVVAGYRAGWFHRMPPASPATPVKDPVVPPVGPAAPVAVTPSTGPAPESQPSGPATLAGDIVIEPNVTYCLELGPGRIGQRSGVAALATESIRTLGPARSFDIAACSGGTVTWYDGKNFRPGGVRAAGQMEEFFARLGASGGAPVADAFAHALKAGTRTVVVLAWSTVEAAAAAAWAKKEGVKVVVVCVAGNAAAASSLELLARQSGGSFRLMTSEQVETFVETLEKTRAGREDR